MAERVGIVAVAQTKFQPNREEMSAGELVWETIEPVLNETGLKFTNDDGRGDIESIVTCSQDYWDGMTISSMGIMSFVGGHHATEDKIAEDSLNALFAAYAQIRSGHFDIVLVSTHTKESMADRSIVESVSFDPVMMRPLGLDFFISAALQARRYMDKYGITPEQCAKVASKNRGNGMKNPVAQEPMNITVEDVLKSKMLIDPIHQLDTKPVSDGSIAMILAREDKAKKLTKKPIWITGVSNCYETHYLGDRDLVECEALVTAARRAYKMAGITLPAKEIDVAEICDEYSYQELLWMEGLGLCGRGEAGRVIDAGVTQIGGKLPVNTSGGMLCGNPTTVAGMARAAEVVLQLRGEAGERQVPGARVGLAHGTTGACGQHQCVMTFSNK
ncbi:MAG: thiolase family protein [Chloroflexi bacterium]|nr:thiolase family protein [Chloroflexota bacterium]